MDKDEIFDIDLNLSSPNEILGRLGVNQNGRAQVLFAAELMEAADDYVPRQSSALRMSARVVNGGAAIEYRAPYARLHWYGKIMVDPVYHCGGIFIKDRGFVSRKYVKKVLSNRDFTYWGAPKRGPFWVLRAWYDHKDEITGKVADEMTKGGR